MHLLLCPGGRAQQGWHPGQRLLRGQRQRTWASWMCWMLASLRMLPGGEVLPLLPADQGAGSAQHTCCCSYTEGSSGRRRSMLLTRRKRQTSLNESFIPWLHSLAHHAAVALPEGFKCTRVYTNSSTQHTAFTPDALHLRHTGCSSGSTGLPLACSLDVLQALLPRTMRQECPSACSSPVSCPMQPWGRPWPLTPATMGGMGRQQTAPLVAE